jgi:MYXO-CTERM domain-containing protein
MTRSHITGPLCALLLSLPLAAEAAPPLHLPWTCAESHAISQGHQIGSHKGFGEWAWDANLPVGTLVTAPAAGVIRVARDDSSVGGCSSAFAHDGNYAVIAFEDGTEALLLHLAKGSLRVRPGQTVRAGDPIGTIGLTGWTCGAHLHFQVQDTCASWWCQSIPAQLLGVGDPRTGAALTSESCPDTGEGYIVVVQTPDRIDRGQAWAEVTVRVRNTGDQVWRPGEVSLVSAGPNTLSWEQPDGALCPVEEGCAVPLTQEVSPGQEIEHTWRVTPSKAPPQLALRVARQDAGTWTSLSGMEAAAIPLCDPGKPCVERDTLHAINNPSPRAEGGCTSAPGGTPAPTPLLLLLPALIALTRRRPCAPSSPSCSP